MAAPGNRLALEGGTPIRRQALPYGSHWIDEDSLQAVEEVLRSEWITTGPKVAEFEHAFASLTGASCAVALSSGTAALHAALAALRIGPGDEVIVPAMTFVATANAVVFQGATPVLTDVDPDTLLVDPAAVQARITSRTKAIMAVDFAGQTCHYAELLQISKALQIPLVVDACHSLGGSYLGKPVGSIGLLNCFSLHPVKPVTTGEGGMVTTADPQLAAFIRRFRNHGIDRDLRQRKGDCRYEMVELGFNYRLTDFQCALGLAQLSHLPCWLQRRREIAARYQEEIGSMEGIRPLVVRDPREHAWHLFVIRFLPGSFRVPRQTLFEALRQEGILTNLHYLPVHLHAFYRQRFGTGPGLCPNAECAYQEICTLPLFPRMTDHDVNDVLRALKKVWAHYRK